MLVGRDCVVFITSFLFLSLLSRQAEKEEADTQHKQVRVGIDILVFVQTCDNNLVFDSQDWVPAECDLD